MYLTYSGFFDAMRRRYFRKLMKTCGLSTGSRLLDYGCGPGDLMTIAKEAGVDVVGVDASPRSVALARERGLDVVCGDARALGDRDGAFDAIVLQSVIEHIAEPLPELLLLKRMLRPGGALVVSAPTPCSSFWDDPTHIRPYTPKSLRVLGELLEMDVAYLSYVFAYLLGVRLQGAWIYKLMNLVPLPLGSNLIAVYRSPER